MAFRIVIAVLFSRKFITDIKNVSALMGTHIGLSDKT